VCIYIYVHTLYIYIYVHFFIGSGTQRGLWPPRSRSFVITHNDAPQSEGLLWTSDQLVAETARPLGPADMYTYIWKIFLRNIISVTSKKTYRFKNKNCSNFNTIFSHMIHPVLLLLRTIVRTSVSFSRTQHFYLKRWLHVSFFQKAICRP
jgi:hypothetical protein